MIMTVTTNAATRLLAIQEKCGAKAMLLGLQGGGCSGLKYIMRPATEAEIDEALADVRVLNIGLSQYLVVDKKSAPYLQGMRMEYQSTLMQSGFVFSNPNAAKTCGCGTSFTPK